MGMLGNSGRLRLGSNMGRLGDSYIVGCMGSNMGRLGKQWQIEVDRGVGYSNMRRYIVAGIEAG